MSIVQHNLMAMGAGRQLNISMDNKQKSSEKLSSGYRINRSADDAAGLSISEKMRAQIRGLGKGSDNTKDGVALCQVADGALAEVSKMLHRITELSVQAANDTNTADDRRAIQSEISKLIQEIDRISDTTEYNNMPLFKGMDTIATDANGNPIINSSFRVDQLQLADIDLGRVPFSDGSNGNYLGLQATANSSLSWKFIYGNGSTSNSSFRLTYMDNGVSKTDTVRMANLTATNFRVENNDTWLRDFQYTNADGVDVTITQKVQIQETSTHEKNYNISYAVQNNNATDIGIDFMFHTDTAYNNNDRCEGYYINGNRVNRYSVYSDANSPFTAGSTSSNVINGVPDSFSIVDVDKALAFSEKIQMDPNNKPDSISIGQYSSIHDWSYYKNIRNNTNSQLGTNTRSQDLGFSLIWNRNLGGNSSQVFNFSYGIIDTEFDNNLQNVPINKDMGSIQHSNTRKFWIQSGDQKDSGLYLTIDEMSTNKLGINTIDVTTHDNAERAIQSAANALESVNKQRSSIGVQQNRQEHIIAYDDNARENTVAAESRIRDTDMADEMVRYSRFNIIHQAGQSILAQANQSMRSVVDLLQ